MTEQSDTMVREIRHETRERLEVLDVSRLDREEKRKLEETVAKGADRVEYAERDWRKRRPETLDEIKRAVDALGSPREERLRVGERVFLPPEEPLPPTRQLTTVERQAIERHIGGSIKRASIVYRSARGHVVEVEHEREGAKHMTLLSVLGDRVRALDDIRSRIDSFEPKGPAVVEEPPALEAPPETAHPTLTEPPTETPPEPAPATAVEPVAEEAPAKKRFALPRFGRAKKAAEAPPEAEPAPAEEAAPKKRFALPKIGRKKAEAPPETAAPEEAPAGPPPSEESPKGLGRFLKRRRS